MKTHMLFTSEGGGERPLTIITWLTLQQFAFFYMSCTDNRP